jgi:hypothetical protein
MVLRRIFGPITEEVREGWRKFHNMELQNLYSPQILLKCSHQRELNIQGM